MTRITLFNPMVYKEYMDLLIKAAIMCTLLGTIGLFFFQPSTNADMQTITGVVISSSAFEGRTIATISHNTTTSISIPQKYPLKKGSNIEVQGSYQGDWFNVDELSITQEK